MLKLFNRPRGVLSGLEIADAVKRQGQYAAYAYRHQPERLGGSDLGWWECLHFRWLAGQPRIHIDDFTPVDSNQGGRLNPNSYNLSLHPDLLVYDIQPPSDSRAHSQMACGVLDMKHDNLTRRLSIPESGLVLQPGVLYIGRTVEYTESHNVRPCLNGRSSIGRLGIMIHVTAGYGDVGFKGTWTLEILVVHPVRVYPGVKICQIDYATCSRRHVPYASKKYLGQTDPTASKLFMDFKNEQDGNQPGYAPAPGGAV